MSSLFVNDSPWKCKLPADLNYIWNTQIMETLVYKSFRLGIDIAWQPLRIGDMSHSKHVCRNASNGSSNNITPGRSKGNKWYLHAYQHPKTIIQFCLNPTMALACLICLKKEMRTHGPTFALNLYRQLNSKGRFVKCYTNYKAQCVWHSTSLFTKWIST